VCHFYEKLLLVKLGWVGIGVVPRGFPFFYPSVGAES
jgi:hypothetical protein